MPARLVSCTDYLISIPTALSTKIDRFDLTIFHRHQISMYRSKIGGGPGNDCDQAEFSIYRSRGFYFFSFLEKNQLVSCTDYFSCVPRSTRAYANSQYSWLFQNYGGYRRKSKWVYVDIMYSEGITDWSQNVCYEYAFPYAGVVLGYANCIYFLPYWR